MENRIITRSLNKQLDWVVLHEQVENGIAISSNLSADQEDQRFETPKRVFQIKQKHQWIEERPTCHRTPHVALIILHEMQTSEAKDAIVVYYKIPGRKNVILNMQTHRLNLNKGVKNLNLDRKLCQN